MGARCTATDLSDSRTYLCPVRFITVVLGKRLVWNSWKHFWSRCTRHQLSNAIWPSGSEGISNQTCVILMMKCDEFDFGFQSCVATPATSIALPLTSYNTACVVLAYQRAVAGTCHGLFNHRNVVKLSCFLPKNYVIGIVWMLGASKFFVHELHVPSCTVCGVLNVIFLYQVSTLVWPWYRNGQHIC